MGGENEANETRGGREAMQGAAQGAISPHDESSVQQSEKDQRMWSALKTSLLSGGSVLTDQSVVGLCSGRTDYEPTPGDLPAYVGDRDEEAGGDATRITFFSDRPGMKGNRDMEQLESRTKCHGPNNSPTAHGFSPALGD